MHESKPRKGWPGHTYTAYIPYTQSRTWRFTMGQDGHDCAYRGEIKPHELRFSRSRTKVAVQGGTPVPYGLLSMAFTKQTAGMSTDEAGQQFAASTKPHEVAESYGFAGEDLECWLLPIVQFALDFLVVPKR